MLSILVEILREQCFNFHSESFLPSTQGSPGGKLCIMLSHPSLKPMANSSHSECVLKFFNLEMNAPQSGITALRTPARNSQPCHAFLRPQVNTGSIWDPCSNSFILPFKIIYINSSFSIDTKLYLT